ncbi:hypothetical protein BRADI_4g05023v3 [Brachypodium distachyon]|uniref:Uncharacterized protein n=1 Tax=Brachypodium distachyon TaxID=15368 RepID=A0A2K2CKK2_BRADI|nr:hypothetical protein BRADI_4g05023v3 [Brachypodium distachyon]
MKHKSRRRDSQRRGAQAGVTVGNGGCRGATAAGVECDGGMGWRGGSVTGGTQGEARRVAIGMPGRGAGGEREGRGGAEAGRGGGGGREGGGARMGREGRGGRWGRRAAGRRRRRRPHGKRGRRGGGEAGRGVEEAAAAAGEGKEEEAASRLAG